MRSKRVQRISKRSELVALAQRLGMREDWHEPDEQEVTVTVRGNVFDNAGFWPEPLMGTTGGRPYEICEKHVVIMQGGAVVAMVNLASLFAWASEERGA